MADFISALTGVQMDQALMDMAEHNSEAYAVGERNGIAVASDDVTYHNNARYYAQIASSQIVGDASSAVRWDTDQSEALTDAQKAVARNNINAASDSDVVKITSQTLTSAEQEQARANIMAGGSNRNLLDNPWWGSGEVVNQRSVTAKPSSNGAYCIDRWTWNSGADANNMSLGANGITFTRSASRIWFAQKMANPSALVGKKITGSVMLSDGTIKSGSVVYASVGSTPTLYEDSAVQIYISSVGAFSLTIKTTQTIRAVKLELGSVSTLANDVSPDYGTELLKCMRYFIRIKGDPIGSGYVTAGLNQAYIHIPTPVPMRTAPTASINGSMYIRGTGATWNVSSVTVPSTSLQPTNGVSVIAAVSATQVMAVGAYMSSANSYIDLTADL